MVLGDLLVKFGVKIDAFGRLFLKRPNFENPSKTIVFPMYFEGRALKYHVKINEKTEQNGTSKSINRNNRKS